ncbi:MAG TPA: alpha/beta fold hydrolase [Thermoanaerobaculia bacterium]|jgi:pimeloyl-ACP methyl ester carboxylesterase|nr:alpha/beta fold hydrolase [Thermoanaerobaculia bacterium]
MRLWPVLLLLTAAPAWADFVEIPGGKLWYESRGEGPPLVLLHDGFASSGTWDDQMPAFARLFRTIRYDRRGYGKSESNQEPYSHLDDLATFLGVLKIDRAVLVGCDNGARLALDYALAHPDRVSALVLSGPVVSGLPFSEHFTRRGTGNFKPMFQNQDVAGLIEAWVQDPYETDPANTRARERLRELLKTSASPLTMGFPDSRPPDKPAAGRLGEVRVPTLIVVGASDIADIHAQAGVLEAGIPGARRVVLAGAGHLAHLEKPELFNETVLTFLRPDDAAASYLKSLAGDRMFEQSRGLFDYDRSAPLDIKEAGTEMRGQVRVIDLSYASPLGGRVPAWLVLPAGNGKHPAAVWMHPGQGDRSTFLDEAVAMAGRGLVSLLVGGPFTRPENPRGGNPWDPETSRKEQVQGIVDVRRGFDLLAARPEVDPKRMAYVGHSYGATIGGTLAAVERRPIAHVLMAGFPSLTHSWTDGHNQQAVAFQTLLPREGQEAYVKALAPVDAVHYVGHVAPAKLFFQFARHDEFISEWDAAVYVQAASEPKEVKWYDSDHFFNEEARRDRDEWLAKVLGL